MDFIIEEMFGLPIGDPRVIETLDFILKNWNPEEETFQEFQYRIFSNQPKRLNPESANADKCSSNIQ